MTVKEIADLVQGELVGDGSVEIKGVASLEHAGADEVSFLGSVKHKEAALASKAGALIVSKAVSKDVAQVVVADPYSAFVKVMEYFHPVPAIKPGVHKSAVIEKGAKVDKKASVGPLTYIGAGAVVGSKTVIGAGAVIGAGSVVGKDCVIHPRVTLYPGTMVGSRVVIHSGTVIGSDGFGYVLSDQGHVKKPQVGRVEIGDDVEIGANCAIDRAMLDATVIGAGTKLDNLVHLAHGVRVGRNCIILAHAAVGGSVKIGDFCIISGNVTIKDNVTLGDRVTVAGHSAVADDVAAGQIVWGFPAMPFSLAKRVYARTKQLPQLFTRVRALEKKSGGQGK
jgi:UDP-3-O-[3-hydroxymyristoyl] glucosamine N-acyltransferase